MSQISHDTFVPKSCQRHFMKQKTKNAGGKKKRKIILDRTTPRRIIVNMRKAIIERLDRIGKSKLWLAEQMDVRPATIYDFLSGKEQIKSDTADRMLGVLGLEIRPKE